jgi:hypothetical protein
MSYGQFRTYVWRIRKRLGEKAVKPRQAPERVASLNRETVQPVVQGPRVALPEAARDPLANIRREQERKRASGFVYDPVPDDGK